MGYVKLPEHFQGEKRGRQAEKLWLVEWDNNNKAATTTISAAAAACCSLETLPYFNYIFNDDDSDDDEDDDDDDVDDDCNTLSLLPA